MEISNPTDFDQCPRAANDTIVDANGSVLRVKVVIIPPWNMDADFSFAFAHGLDGTKILSVEAAIIRDDASRYTNLAAQHLIGSEAGGKTVTWTPTEISLQRLTGGTFDNVNYDDTIIDRGRCLVWYYE